MCFPEKGQNAKRAPFRNGLFHDPEQGPQSTKNPRPYRVVMGFLCPLLFTQAALGSSKGHKKTPLLRGFSLRSRADSNRCTRFCRPLPSRSATGPCVKRMANIINPPCISRGFTLQRKKGFAKGEFTQNTTGLV